MLEVTGKLTAALRDKKEAEERVTRELTETLSRHKAELERRESQRATEVGRLQAALQEKTKALKVAELELARIKAKAGGASPSTGVRPAPEPADSLDRTIPGTTPIPPRTNVAVPKPAAVAPRPVTGATAAVPRAPAPKPAPPPPPPAEMDFDRTVVGAPPKEAESLDDLDLEFEKLEM